MTTGWRVAGPGNRSWSIWDHGDELTVRDGPNLTDTVVARVPTEWTKRLTPGERWAHVEGAASAVHAARLLDSDVPIFRQLWR